MKNIIKKINLVSKSVLRVFVLSVFLITGFSGNVFANTYQLPCPFSPATNRTIVNFSSEFVWGKNAAEVTKSVNLPAGDYKVSLQSFDGYDGGNQKSQPNESYFVEFVNGSGVVARSAKTPDLQDNVTNASYAGTVNSSIKLSQAVTSVKARHANFLQDVGGANSVTAGCAAFDLVSEPIVASCSATHYNCSAGTLGAKAEYPDTAHPDLHEYQWFCNGNISTPNTIASGNILCREAKTPPPTSNLSASCSVNPSSVNIGESLNWSVSATGGTGSYTYSWTGADSLSGTGSTVSKTYSTAGTKTGTVTITSGTGSGIQSVVKTCSALVSQNVVNNLSVSCSASPSSPEVDEDVTWRANASGGDGDYDYDWSGTDDLEGDSRTVTWSYDDDGTKRATVTVDSDGQTASASCSVSVDEEEEEDDLSVSCYANPTSVQTGTRMNWYVRVTGGDGDYDYEWEGDDDLDSSSRSPTMTYYSAGRKSAEVTVSDDSGNEDSDTCSVNVNSVLAFTQTYQPVAPEAVYLSQVPYTGIADNYKLSLFLGVLALFSAWISYIVVDYKKKGSEIE